MPLLPLDPQGRLNADLPCIKCGYNLRASDPASNCPECGTPLDRSLQPNLLVLADPVWLKRVISGLGWLLVATVLGFALTLCDYYRLIQFILLKTDPFEWANPLLRFVGLPQSVLDFIAWMRLTTPVPLATNSKENLPLRRVIRSLICFRFALSLIGVAYLPIPSTPALTILRFVLVPVLLGTVFIVASFTFLRKLALRIPSQKLARQARWLMWFALSLIVIDTVLSSEFWTVSYDWLFDFIVMLVGYSTSEEANLNYLLQLTLFLWLALFLNRLRKAVRQTIHRADAAGTDVPAQIG